MILKPSRFGPFYGCSRWPNCKGSHGAHKDGTPLGTPANAETKGWRIQAHRAFDTLWQGDGTLSRTEAYRWLQVALQLSPADAHIGQFGIDQCRQLIAAVESMDQLAQINTPDSPSDPNVWHRRAQKRRRRQKHRKKVKGRHQ